MRRLSFSLVAAALLCIPALAADPIKIGLVNETTGPNAEAGSYTVNGTKLAVEEINAKGGILGRQIELRIEDNQSTNPGTVLAYSKLTGEGGITAIVGPIRSTQIQAASPTIQKGGIPALVGGTDPSLTKVNNPWIFRVRPNDSYSSRVIADFGVNSLQLKKWAIVHSTDAFGSGGMKALTTALQSYGVTPVLIQGYTNNSQDYTPIVLAIKKSGADILATYMTNSQDLGIFAKQLRQLGVGIPWVGSPSIVTDTAMKLAGPALFGTYAVADFTPGSGAEAKSFAVADHALYGQTARALEELRWALDRGTAPVLVTSAMAGGLRSLAKFISAPRGMRNNDLMREVGVPAWKLDTLRRQSHGWDADGLGRAIRSVARADADVKGQASDPAYALEKMVLDVVRARPRS